MANNYFSNANPAQNALNNMNPKNIPYPGFNQQTPQSNGVTLPGAKVNTGYTIYPKAPKTPTVSNTGTSNTSVPKTNNTGLSNSPFPKTTQTQVSTPTVNKPAQYSPQSYADYYQNKGNISQQEQSLINQAQDIGSKYGQVRQSDNSISGPAGLINRISDADLARYQTELGANQQALTGLQSGLTRGAGVGQGLLSASLPQTIGPTDYAYNPLTGAQGANEGAGSAENRVFRAGQLGAIQGQGGQSVQFNQAQNTISNIKSLLGNDNHTAITKLNSFVNDIRNNVSSPSRAQFEATLGGLANAVSAYNPQLAQQLSGDALKNSSGAAILSAINQAQQIIQGQQQAISSGQSSGSTGGGFAETW